MCSKDKLSIVILNDPELDDNFLLLRLLEGYNSKLLFSSLWDINISNHWRLNARMWNRICLDSQFRGFFRTSYAINVSAKYLTIYNHTFSHDEYSFCVNAILNSDCVLLVHNLSETETCLTDLTSQLLLFKKLNVKQIIFLVDNLDSSNQLLSFNQFKGVLLKLCLKVRFQPQVIKIIPICSITNQNILIKSKGFSWFSEGSVCDTLQNIHKLTDSMNKKNLRVHWNAELQTMERLYGQMCETAESVFSLIESDCFSVTMTSYNLRFKSNEIYQRSNLIFVSKNDLDTLDYVSELEVEIFINMNQRTRIVEGEIYDFCYCQQTFKCLVVKITAQFSAISGKSIERRNSLYPGEYGYARVKLLSLVRVDLYAEYPVLGIFFIRAYNYDILVFVKKRKFKVKFTSELKAFQLCINGHKSKLFRDEKNPRIDHLEVAITNRNIVAFEELCRRPELEHMLDTDYFKLNVEEMMTDIKQKHIQEMLAIILSKSEMESMRKNVNIELLPLLTEMTEGLKKICSLYSKWPKPKQCFDSITLNNELKTIVNSLSTYKDPSYSNPKLPEFKSLERRSLLDQLLDPHELNSILVVKKVLMNINVNENFFLRSAIDLNDSSVFEIIFNCNYFRVVSCNAEIETLLMEASTIEEIEHLIDIALKKKSSKILMFLLAKYPQALFKSSKPSKYLQYIQSFTLEEHLDQFLNFFQYKLPVENLHKLFNLLTIATLYYDNEQYSFMSKSYLLFIYQYLRDHPEMSQPFDCFMNFIEAKHFRNQYNDRLDTFFTTTIFQKYDSLKVKVCSNSQCDVTLLDILRSHEVSRLVGKCYRHQSEVQPFTIGDIEKLICNKYIAIYVYFFYRIFKISIEFIEKTLQSNPLLLNFLGQIDQTHILKIMFNDSQCVEEFFLF